MGTWPRIVYWTTRNVNYSYPEPTQCTLCNSGDNESNHRQFLGKEVRGRRLFVRPVGGGMRGIRSPSTISPLWAHMNTLTRYAGHRHNFDPVPLPAMRDGAETMVVSDKYRKVVGQTHTATRVVLLVKIKQRVMKRSPATSCFFPCFRLSFLSTAKSRRQRRISFSLLELLGSATCHMQLKICLVLSGTKLKLDSASRPALKCISFQRSVSTESGSGAFVGWHLRCSRAQVVGNQADKSWSNTDTAWTVLNSPCGPTLLWRYLPQWLNMPGHFL